MKRLFVSLFFVMMVLSAYAVRKTIVEDSLLTKSESFELAKFWIATKLDSYNALITYEDKTTGRIVVKGKYKDTKSNLMSLYYGFTRAYISFQLEISCSEGKVSASLNKVDYTIEALGGDYSSMGKTALNNIVKELKAMVEMKEELGEVWSINNSFMEKAELLYAHDSESGKAKVYYSVFSSVSKLEDFIFVDKGTCLKDNLLKKNN